MIDDELFHKADRIFQAAIDLPPADRRRLLDRECGDDQRLRGLVERLLESARDATSGPEPGGGVSELDPDSVQPQDDPLIGSRLDRYELLREIGRGGMGVVYEALDTRLQRTVAVKVLSPTTLDHEGRERFLREARASAALNHPYIVAVHDAGEAQGRPYLVMEFIDGSSLEKSPPATLIEAVEIACRVCDALEHAHSRRLVHRDLKPGNILSVERGGKRVVKLTDLGIVFLRDSTRVTKTGVVAGTPNYMAPEQALGRPVDGRADLYALGVMLYRWTVGQLPFHGDDAMSTLSQHIHAPVVSPRQRRADYPESLERILLRLLAKDPQDRFADAGRLRESLEAFLTSEPTLSTAPSVQADTITEPTLTVDSLAVLPFHNEAGDPDSEYLCDGLTESLIDNLSQLPRLRVMARSTVFQYKDQRVTALQVGETLDVRAVLTGDLSQHKDTLLLRVELTDVKDGQHLWGKRFRRPLADFLEIEEEIAREIADNLRFELSASEREKLEKRHTDSPEAHQLVLKGRHVWSRWKTPEGMQTSIGFFERALQVDPLYARAFAGLADSYSVLGNIKALPPGEAYPKARTAAQQGLAIDDQLAELHTSLGFIQRMWDWDWEAARCSYERAIQLNPGYATAYRWYAHLLSGLAQHQQALDMAQRACSLDPLSLLIRGAMGDVLFYARRYDEAIAVYKETLAVDPDFLAGHTDLGRAYELAGRYDEAIACFEKAGQLASKGPPEPSSGLAHVYAQMGRRRDALAIVEQLLELSRKRYVSPYGIASIHACLGDNETALQWLEKAYHDHDQTLVWINVHPRLDGLRCEPRFEDLLKKMHF